MAQHKAKYLRRRGPNFQIRLAIPKDIQAAFGRKELRWSLRTMSAEIAEKRALLARLAFLELCDTIRTMKTLSKPDIQNLVQQYYSQLTTDDPTPAPNDGEEIDIWTGKQEEAGESYVAELEQECLSHSYSQHIKKKAEQELVNRKIPIKSVKEADFRALCHGIARAEIEFEKFLEFRRKEPILSYTPQDTLFTAPPPPSLQLSASGATNPKQQGLTISEGVEKFVTFKTSDTGGWPTTDAKSRRRGIDWYAALVDPDKLIGQLLIEDFREYRDLLYKLKKNTPAKADIRFHQAEHEADRVHSKTMNQYFQAVKSFLNWLEAEGHSSNTLVGKIQLNVKTKPTKPKSLTNSTLEAFLGSPLFAGCSSGKKRYEPGDKQFKDDFFWMPLLALYSGARMAELLQLKPSSFVFKPSVAYFEISAEGQLKNEQSARKVPIHKDLETWGLREFVKARSSHAIEPLLQDLQPLLEKG